MNNPNPAQLQAVREYAERKGKDWKDKLLTAWLNGSDASEPSGHLLRQLRNQFGPAWLAKYED